MNKYILTEELIRSFIKPREKFSHKGTYGHALIVAGSYGKMGAAILAAKACLRSGVGLLTIHVPQKGYEIIQTSVPEAIVEIDKNSFSSSQGIDADVYSAVGIGPGLGNNEFTEYTLKQLLLSTNKPMVLDADALNIISLNKDILKMIPANSILTPHPKEFERLTKKTVNSIERHQMQIEFSRLHHVYVLLKGADTCITTPEGISYFNSTGNSGLAKGGSGDVLTGIITSLLAQGYAPLQASLIGAYVHGLSADLLKTKKGEIGMIPSDVIESLPEAFLKLSNIKEEKANLQKKNRNH